ncbi:MAG: bifunctional DNA-formamidopyrimidine glycosylase/DNA-(apurinic or apyrimidinic site) lyase [Rhodobacteraceae bacterium]|nr:bifunctional DNA-formamidopyrimidine glycosylase/DNA-(apurinic or apyrimidinic site) lyase [Paracoccaceae bacterium]
MPELPEVETVMRGLMPVMDGQQIVRAEVRREGLRWPFPEHFGARLTGARVEGMQRRAKYILMALDSGESLLVHLGMSGKVTIDESGALPPEKHDHVILDMANGVRILFNDPRRFGSLDLLETTSRDNHKLLKALGPEPLGNSFNAAYFSARLKGRKTPIKSAMLDQKIVAGLGNIYVCEALWRAGIAPQSSSAVLKPARVSTLVGHIRDVLSEAIAAGGSSLKDYRQANGELGYFQHSFKTYGREGEPCLKPACGGEIARITQSGRSSFYCPRCQKHLL